MLFREGVIAFFVGETKEEKEAKAKLDYCKACKTAKKDDCGNCSRKIEIKTKTNAGHPSKEGLRRQ